MLCTDGLFGGGEEEDEDEEDRARADSHERLEDKACVEADSVERSNTARTRVSEELGMEEHDSKDEVQAEEHG